MKFEEENGSGRRIARISESYHKELSHIMQTEVGDPRLVGVYITQVKFAPDLKLAKVYFNVDGGRVREDEVIAGFEKSKGFLKRELATRVRIKYTPDLTFYYDDTKEFVDKMDALFDKIRKDTDEEDEESEID